MKNQPEFNIYFTCSSVRRQSAGHFHLVPFCKTHSLNDDNTCPMGRECSCLRGPEFGVMQSCRLVTAGMFIRSV